MSGGTGGRVVSLEEARARIAAWRAAQERIALAHGAFDLLNAEHARFLAAAREGAARLVVVVAPAEAGGTLVYQSESERARLVAALRGVDAVAPGSRSEADALAAEAGARLAVENDLAARRVERVRAAYGKP